MKAKKNYEKEIHKILKTYNSILVKCKNVPILSDKNIIMVENVDSMINAQIETRKPILYFQEEKSISFMLLDGTEAYIYIIKADKGVQSEVEQIINNIEISRNTFVKGILSKLEKVLLNGNNEKVKKLTKKELKYHESIKEEELNKKNESFSEKNINLNERNSSENSYLIPVKEKKGQKSKMAKEKNVKGG